ncbi:hypothetical protein T492DRAFT_1044325, partial [Pavlovales sp. CCMP2436]
MQTPVPATPAPFQSPDTPATASPRRSMQVLSGLPAVTISPPTPSPHPTKSAGRKAIIASAYTEYPEAGASSKPYEEYQTPPTMSRRQMQIGELNLGLTSNELKQIGKMSDLRTRPAKTPQDENAQIARLMSNEIILQKIIEQYGDLSTKG